MVERFSLAVKWMVFGAGGQLGRALVHRFQAKHEQHEFVAYSHNQADITNFEQIIDLVSTYQPNLIVNAAAWTDVAGAELQIDLASKVNTQGAINIAKAASHFGASLIQISTDYVFSGKFVKPIIEHQIQSPINNYGLTKANAEILLEKEFKNSVVILRTAWLYGPGGKNFARTIIAKALMDKEEEIRVVDDQWGQPTSTLDLAEKIIEIGEKRITTGIFHATNSGKTSWFEFAQLLFASAGLDSTLLKSIKTSDISPLVKRPVYSVLSHDGWEGAGIAPMRDWKFPVSELATVIRREVEIEHGI
jgi:dTDP-4-dehydrorhamnose reductase